MSPFQRAQLRLYWRTYAASQPTPQRALGMAKALGRYFTTQAYRKRDWDDGPVESVQPIGRTQKIEDP